MASNKKWITLFIFFLIIFLTWSCKGERKSIEDSCDYDGVKIEPIYAVFFILQDGTEKKFCSIVCASMSFPELKKQIKKIRVVDEPSGAKINASQAFFVESEMVNVPHIKNRTHVFAKKEDALKHIQKFKGNWVENPYRDQYQGTSVSNPPAFPDVWIEEKIEGQAMKIKIDPSSGLPRIIRGLPSVIVLKAFDPTRLTKKGAQEVLASLLLLFRRYLDMDISEFKLSGMECVEGTWYISFWQTYKGVIIYESSIGFSIGPKGDIPSVGVLLHKSHKERHLPTWAKLSLKEATALAKAYLRKTEPWDHTLRAYQLVIYPLKKGGKVDYYLAYILNLYSPENQVVGSSRIGWACFVDAVNGKIVDAFHLLAMPNCCEVVTEDEQ
jgi:hypothetical protein